MKKLLNKIIKNKKMLFLIILMIVILIAVGVVFTIDKNNNYKSEIAEGKISKEELERSDAILQSAGTPDYVIEILTVGQKYYISKNLNSGAAFKTSEISSIDPSESENSEDDRMMKFTALVYSINVDGAEENQVFTLFQCPNSNWGINGDKLRVSMDSSWRFNDMDDKDISLTWFLENSDQASEMITYLTSHRQSGRNDVLDEYGFDMPADAWYPVEGYIYTGCTMTYIKNSNPDETELKLTYNYTHNNSVIYTKGVFWDLSNQQ